MYNYCLGCKVYKDAEPGNVEVDWEQPWLTQELTICSLKRFLFNSKNNIQTFKTNAQRK
jgi:hypothetical protein